MARMGTPSTPEKPTGFSFSAVTAYKEYADRTIAQIAENNAILEEQTSLLEDELRELRYARHSLSHSEPDDVDSPAHERWEERYDLYTRHIEEAEVELANLLATAQN